MRQLLLLPRAAQAVGRVAQERSLASQEAKPGAKRGEAASDRAAGIALFVEPDREGPDIPAGQVLQLDLLRLAAEEVDRLGEVLAIRLHRQCRGVFLESEAAQKLGQSF